MMEAYLAEFGITLENETQLSLQDVEQSILSSSGLDILYFTQAGNTEEDEYVARFSMARFKGESTYQEIFYIRKENKSYLERL